MYFFIFDQKDKQSNIITQKVNTAVYSQRNRTDILELEAKLLVLRLLQLRDSKKTQITSVKQGHKELLSPKNLERLNLSQISITEINKLSSSIGYVFSSRIKGHSQVYSKVNVEINGKRYGIRCFDHTERPLINHSTREKYEKLCKKSGVSINGLDAAVASYWECRKAGVFNEDCIYTSPLNPFLEIKEDLRKLLTYVAFHAYNINTEYNNPEFELEKLDGYIDYTNPCDERTWDVLNESRFFDKVWTHLRFSFRADRGMPNGGLVKPTDNSILKWTRQWKDRQGQTVYKGALHIRICKYSTAINDTPFEKLFSVLNSEAIKAVSINQREKDEYLLKLFLVDCRKNKLPVPIGNNIQVVKNIENSRKEEIGYPDIVMDWNSISSGLLVYICQKIKAGKAGAFDKADVYINGIGISVKSRRGQPPTIINQTSREKILRVMRAINNPIAPLDRIVNRYWEHRLSTNGPEDVSYFRDPQNAFSVDEKGNSNLPILKPLLNYFAFKGTGTKDSDSPAKYILSIENPVDTNTWVYYDENNFVEAVWYKMLFSIRGKGLPKKISDEIMPWVRDIGDEKKGTLNVRVGI